MTATLHLPSIVGSTESAKLPSSYQAAKEALAACEAIDECKDWADKMAAPFSYAAQAKDEELLRCARRIQGRALRRDGELLQRLDARGDHWQSKKEGSLLSSSLASDGGGIQAYSRTEAAREAGISEHQQKQALRLPNIPEPEFEDLVEGFDPPSITELAEHGTRRRDDSVHVSKNSGNNEWYTPAEVIEAARDCMGGIDLDPGSSEAANKIVQASEYYTIEDDGLRKPWSGRVWLNPPYGQPIIAQFSEKLISSLASIEQACVLVNNATETAWFQSIARACTAMCFVKGRVRFLDPTGNPAGAPDVFPLLEGDDFETLTVIEALPDYFQKAGG
jgi:phage N-6-adenine-methyltransferase